MIDSALKNIDINVSIEISLNRNNKKTTYQTNMKVVNEQLSVSTKRENV